MSMEVFPVQLPGREERIRERPLTSAGELARHIVPTLLPHLDKPFAFFGHSMGALMAYEVAQHLRLCGRPEPKMLIVSARRAPQTPFARNSTWDLPHDGFLERLRSLDGTSPAVMDNPELMQLLEPVLRADFQVDETYVHPDSYTPLSCPIVAFGAIGDKEPSFDDLLAWGAVTTGGITIRRMFDGNHFFVVTRASELVSDIAATSQDLL
jgi:medium-chain acyl-[acyl-carrier-protein] hydrolase